MRKWIETTGRTEEDAISAALFQLELDRDDVSIEVIERAKSGFLGFGSNPAKVRVSYEVDEEGGKPRPINFLRDEPAAPAPRPEPVKPAPKPEKKPAPAPRPEPKPAPKQEEPAPAEEPEEEETILAAKPGWQPAKPARPERREGRPEQGRKRNRDRGRLREGDDVLIGTPEPPAAPAERPPHHEPVLSPVAEDDEKANRIREFLTGLLERLEVEAVPEIMITDEGNYKVVLQGEDLGAIIGRRGETLDAIQQLTGYALNHGQSKRVRVHIDAEGYRAKREESLRRLAVKMAGKVVRYRRSMTLEPMNAYERHVIHTALQDYPNVTTYSTGVEPNRRTVVAYAPGQK